MSVEYKHFSIAGVERACERLSCRRGSSESPSKSASPEADEHPSSTGMRLLELIKRTMQYADQPMYFTADAVLVHVAIDRQNTHGLSWYFCRRREATLLSSRISGGRYKDPICTTTSETHMVSPKEIVLIPHLRSLLVDPYGIPNTMNSQTYPLGDIHEEPAHTLRWTSSVRTSECFRAKVTLRARSNKLLFPRKCRNEVCLMEINRSSAQSEHSSLILHPVPQRKRALEQRSLFHNIIRRPGPS
jgi:hypothetical protein